MSHPIQTLLLATDFSPCAREAQRHLVTWASTLGAHVHAMHVVEFPPGMDPSQPVNKMYVERLRAAAEPQLQQVVDDLNQANVPTQGRIEVGIPSQQVTATADKLNIGLIVLGTRGLTGLNHLLIGSTAERVVQTAPCPVLTVRLPDRQKTEPDQRPVPTVRIILAPVDFSDCSLDALELAIGIAKAYGADLAIQHVMEPVSFGLDFTLRQIEERRRARLRVETWLSTLGAALEAQGVHTRHLLSDEAPSDGILAQGRSLGCDLIVMGTHGRRGLSHLVSGSVAEHVLRHASCPVLTVKSPKFNAGHRPILATHRVSLPLQMSVEGA